MLDVLICHSRADREVAASIADRLNRGAEAESWLEECDSVATAWDRGLASAAILLVLSTHSVPRRLSRADWQSLLKHVEGNEAPPVGCVLVDDCQFPGLLARNRFFRWSDPPLETLRGIERWVVSLHQPRGDRALFAPARQPWFEGRRRELDTLWETLVDRSGTVVLSNTTSGSGKASLAQEFARAASGHFREILWIGCRDRSPAFIAGDLAAQLDSSSEDVNLIRQHRLLLVFDDVTGDAPFIATPDGRASVLITTRSTDRDWPSHAKVLRIENSKGTLREPIEDAVALRLWHAISVCRTQDFSLELAARIAGVSESEARLAAQSWIDPLDVGATRFRLRASLADTADLESLRRRHAEILSAVFSDWRKQPARCTALVAELETAFPWSLTADWNLAVELGERAGAFLNADNRRTEAAQLYTQLREAAQARDDLEVVEKCSWELSWIQDEGGQIRPRAPARDQLSFDF